MKEERGGGGGENEVRVGRREERGGRREEEEGKEEEEEEREGRRTGQRRSEERKRKRRGARYRQPAFACVFPYRMVCMVFAVGRRGLNAPYAHAQLALLPLVASQPYPLIQPCIHHLGLVRGLW